MVWLIMAVVVLSLAVVWWSDRRHHGHVDQRRVHDGVTRGWERDITMSRRKHDRD
jgi:hypothetical protein